MQRREKTVEVGALAEQGAAGGKPGARALRSGYTTGTCAAAAAKGAAVFWLTGRGPGEVSVPMPEGQLSLWYPVPSDEPELPGFWKVQKDSGDDPDVTNGVWVYARVRPVNLEEISLLRAEGRGYWLSDYEQLYLNGGPGIGQVTKMGLSCPVGHYAINPVPREMILAAVAQACREAGYEDGLLVEIAIPAGVRLAEKTFNPRLGIEGGISVLGTTGILRPMSEDALVETIRLDIRMKALAGRTLLIMTPGNYGEAFLREELGVPLGEAVVCSNFAADAVDMVGENGLRRLLFVGHVGKLIKVAAGARNTHSRYGDGRMETMEEMTHRVLRRRQLEGESWQRLCREVRQANTTEEAVQCLKACGLARLVLTETAEAVKHQLEQWGGAGMEAEAIVFSSAHRVAGMTAGAQGFLECWNMEGERK